MLTMTERDTKMVWDCGMTTEQYEVVFELMKKAKLKGQAESAIIYNLKKDTNFENEWWFESIRGDVKIACDTFKTLNYDEIMNEIVEFAKNIQNEMRC